MAGREDGAWGDLLQRKKGNTVRIYLQNIGGLPADDAGKEKYTHLRHFVTKHSIDLLAMPECSVHWGKTEYKQRLPERTKGWWESVQWSMAYNKMEAHPSVYQPGGTALGIFNAMVHRAQRPGDDKVGLGRWCWGRLRGKNNIIIWVVSVYRPCFSTGPTSTYQQQLRHPDHRLPACPRARFMVELLVEIKEWKAAGEQLMILGDFNDDTSQVAFKRRFQELGLVDALAHLHGQPTWPTHNRGSNPIDAMYISPELLQGATGGYLGFDKGLLSNHRGMWLDLQLEVVFGSSDRLGVASQARRLKCDDPRVITRYNQRLLAELRKEEVVDSIINLDMEH